MNCKKCGAPLVDGDQFCKSCGASVTDVFASNQQSIEPNNVNQNVGVNPTPELFNQNSNNSFNQVSMQKEVNNSVGTQQNNLATQPFEQSSINSQSTNNTQSMPNQQSKQSNGNLKYIIIGVIAVVVIFVGIFGISSLLNKDKTGESVPQAVSKTTYDVTFKEFKFKIPDNLVYEITNDTLMIGNEENTWAAQVELESGSFAQIKTNKSQLQAKFQSLGYTSSAAVEKTVSNTEFITMEVSMSGTNAILAIAKANSMYFMGITAMNEDNEYDYSILNSIASTINSATYIGSSNNIKSNINVDFNKITDLAE